MSGILQARNALEQLLQHITAERWAFFWYTMSRMSDLSIVRGAFPSISSKSHVQSSSDIRTWHSNIEQHASEGVNKILIGNKSDWMDKRAVTEEQGRELADELGIRFMETSAKVNEGVEEAFFTLARYVVPDLF